MQPPKQARQTRQRILDTAAAWFRQKGLAFTSMADLAEVIGVKTSSIYYHFESKDALIEETFRLGIELVHGEVREAVEALGPAATHRERILAAMRAHLATLLGENDYSSANIINYSHAPLSVRQKNREVRAAYGRYWASLLEAAQRDGAIAKDMDLSVARMLLIGALNWTVEWYSPRGKTPDEIADQCCRMFFDGAGRGEESAPNANAAAPTAALAAPTTTPSTKLAAPRAASKARTAPAKRKSRKVLG